MPKSAASVSGRESSAELSYALHEVLSAARKVTDGLGGLHGAALSYAEVVARHVAASIVANIDDVRQKRALSRSRGEVGRSVRSIDRAAIFENRAQPANDESAWDAVVLHANADAGRVRARLLPQLRAAGLRVAGVHELLELGVDRVTALERRLTSVRRIVLVVSRATWSKEASDPFSDFVLVQKKEHDIRARRFSILPVYFDDPDQIEGMPLWIRALTGSRLAEKEGEGAQEMERLIRALASAVPGREG